MHWFKHFCAASDDDFIEELEDKFGLEGYARWWKLLEVIGRGMDKKHPDPSASHSVVKWCSLLKAKRKQLTCFLVYCEKQVKINLQQTENVLTITCPNLLKLRDEYIRKSGQCQDTVRIPSVSVSDSVYVSRSSLQEERKVSKNTVGRAT